MTAAEKAMEEIRSLLDGYFARGTTTNEVDVMMGAARILGDYDYELSKEALDRRCAELYPCPPRLEGAKPHCPDCSGVVGEVGIVW